MSDPITIPPALILGCNTPHGINVLSDWIEEQTGHPLDLDGSGCTNGYTYSNNNVTSFDYEIGYGYGYFNGDGAGCGNGYGYISGYMCGNGIGDGLQYSSFGFGTGLGYGIYQKGDGD